MKHKLLIACSLVAVVVLGVLSEKAYSHHKAKVQAQANVTQQRFVKDSLRIDALQKSNQKLQAECQRFSTVYLQLPTTVRAKVPAPSC